MTIHVPWLSFQIWSRHDKTHDSSYSVTNYDTVYIYILHIGPLFFPNKSTILLSGVVNQTISFFFSFFYANQSKLTFFSVNFFSTGPWIKSRGRHEYKIPLGLNFFSNPGVCKCLPLSLLGSATKDNAIYVGYVWIEQGLVQE